MYNINVRENRRCNQEWTIQRRCQYLVHKTQDENKLDKNPTQKNKTMSNTDPIKTGCESRRPRRASTSC